MTTIPAFDRLNKGNLISLDVAGMLDTIATLINHSEGLKRLVILHKGEGRILGYEETEIGQKDYFYRKITETRKYQYFTLQKKKVILPKYLSQYESEL